MTRRKETSNERHSGAVRRVSPETRRAARQTALLPIWQAGQRVVTGVVLGLVVVSGWWWITSTDWSRVGPIPQWQIEGDVREIDLAALETSLGTPDASLFAVDLGALRTRVQADPWIEDVVVWRRWPATIGLRVTERWAVARWGDDRLIDRFGRPFGPVDTTAWSELPHLEGPAGSEVSMMRRFLSVSERLADAGLEVSGIEQSPRGAWTIHLLDGPEIAMGRSLDVDRLERLIAVIPMTDGLREGFEPERFDLRYDHGMAIAWREQQPESPNSGADASKE